MKKRTYKNTLAVVNRRGFTLTEVLLAVMIVGLIGVALASLTRSAAHEGGVGRSRIVLRNNLASFMRTLRNDLSQATQVSAVDSDLSSTSRVPVLYIAQNVSAIMPTDTLETSVMGKDYVYETPLSPKYITYCFARGTDNANITPSTAYRGGTLYRAASEESYPDCTGAEPILDHVKYIPSSDSVNYPVPYIQKKDGFGREGAQDVLMVKLIVEINSTPIVNDVVEEIFSSPMGY